MATMLGLWTCALIVGASQPAMAGHVFQIDLNDADASVTQPGWSGLDALHTGNGGSVVVDGITFAPFSADGARLRGSTASPDPNALTGDFVFDDGPGEAVGLFFGGAGDLKAGEWDVDVYIWDNDFPTTGNMTVGYRTNTSETIISTTVAPNATNAAISFSFQSDGVSAYDVFVRENNGDNRARLNAVRLVGPTPEPASAGLAAFAVMGFGFITRRGRRQKRD